MKTQWKIQLYPKGGTQGVCDWLSLYLCNETEAEVKAGYEFSILDSKKANRSSFKGIKQFASKTSSKSNKGWGMEKMIEIRSQSQSSQLLPNDSLTIVCNVTIIGPEKLLQYSNNQKSNVMVFKYLQDSDSVKIMTSFSPAKKCVMSRFTAEIKCLIVTRSSYQQDLQCLELCFKQKWQKKRLERLKFKNSSLLPFHCY